MMPLPTPFSTPLQTLFPTIFSIKPTPIPNTTGPTTTSVHTSSLPPLQPTNLTPNVYTTDAHPIFNITGPKITPITTDPKPHDQPNQPSPPVRNSAAPNPHPNPTLTHSMVMCFYVGTNKKNHRYNCHVPTISLVPKSYTLAIKDPNWQRAMLDEYNTLIKNNTWVLVPRPPDANIVLSMWLSKHKYFAHGSLRRYKARLVDNGNIKQLGVDYEKTFSPVVNRHSSQSRCFSALACSSRCQNALLYGNLSDNVYMHQSPGF
ncbi:ribonuclease H-like domain-containing protein [Tanacetum coccineum]|uniref:Ribonuclease H-like domain-containing protein n=1 Tax=Tanacetum coccineum TaxID=301880 RepID=A0ABQ5C526_9ASTR